MLLMTMTIEVICFVACLQCVIPLVRALPPDTGIPLDTEIPTVSGVLLGDNLPGSSPITADITNNAFNIASDSFKETTNAQGQSPSINAIQLQTTNEVVKTTGTGGEVPLSLRSFSTDTQVGSISNSESSVSSQEGGGAALLANSNIKNNVNPTTSASTGRIASNGFLATVAGQRSLPPPIGRLRFSPARVGNTMRLPNNRMRPTNNPFMGTMANQLNPTFNAIPMASGMITPFTVPASTQSLTFSPMNFESQPSMPYLPTSNFAARFRTERRPAFLFRSPELFQPSFFSPPDQTFTTAPFVNSGPDISSVTFPSTSANMPTVQPLPPTMSFQNPVNVLSAQAFTNSEPPRVPISSLPQTAVVSPVPNFSQTSGPRFLPFSTFAGPSVQSSTFSREPETTVTVLPPIYINDFSAFSPPPIEVQSPPPPAQFRQSSMMTGRAPINVTPLASLRLNIPPLSDRTSIPVSFQTTPAFPTPTRMVRLDRVIPFEGEGLFGTHMVGAGAAGAAAAAARAQGITNTGVFSAGISSGIPLVNPILPRWSQFNDVGRPILSNFQAF